MSRIFDVLTKRSLLCHSFRKLNCSLSFFVILYISLYLTALSSFTAMAFPSKRYVDRAVQTSHTCSTQSCTQFSTPGDAHRVPIPSSGCNELSSERQVAHTESGDERSHLETLETCFSDDAGSTRSAYTRTGIGSRCPSERIFQPKRLNSLPNASGTTEHSLGRADNRARIVSMPERDKLGNLEHPVHTETSHGELSDSTDISYYSADSDQGLAGQKSDVERLYPADLPQTPSPPSSPDSVMIIANGGQVAGCFLRRSSTDDDGTYALLSIQICIT